MAHDIRLIQVRDFLRTDVEGNLDLPTSRRVLSDLAKACIDTDNYHVLLDVREATGTLSVVDIWELAAALDEVGLGRRNKIAILNAPKDDFNRAAFFETCSVNRGFNVHTFQDFEAALTWLAS